MTRMRRVERVFQERMRVQQPHARVPPQDRVRRGVCAKLLLSVECVERMLDRRERVVPFVSQQVGLGLPLPRHSFVIHTLLFLGELREHRARLNEQPNTIFREAISERQTQELQQVEYFLV